MGGPQRGAVNPELRRAILDAEVGHPLEQTDHVETSSRGPTPGALQGDDYEITYDENGYPELPGSGNRIGKGTQMSKLAARITKLERSRGNGYVASRFLHGSPEMTVADYERLRERTLDEMVAIGEIREQERNKVFFVRCLAADEVKRPGNGPPIPRRNGSTS